MIQKFRIFLLLGINTIVLYGLVLFLIPGGNTQQLIVIGIAMALMMVAPILIINRALNSMEQELEQATGELAATREELEHIKATLSSITTLDELTGCYNESHFREVLTQHRGMSERGSYYFTLAVLQVDQFNSVVDEHGLGSGNEVLQLFARIVKAALREVDVLSRQGPDTFGVLLSGATEDDAVMVIDRISQLISQIQVVDDEDLKITTSGGITSFHGTELSDELIANASKALEFAVEQGRDRVAGYLYHPPPAKEESDANEPEQAEEGDSLQSS
ncbi:MAG: GGDEF domain-containing protein [Gammaproteobacteria bacterium]|nr:GGDEF domain-containing protein [Gammaproteobacteria bacterium]